ncbi:restriction endonuclease subunit S [Aeromonas jandaei]|uniref:restriction endonuclease subunit S n=1 Tax=Aeromonas jandaei TaxID=650 RepID=UPI0019318DD8|nr:restriction endonuclease subunit S [Aeromonas jandaei]MBM0490296.1 restriction endonuclease subunit S [Aeromonas jandaei]MBM0567794.1 restriction endonuclease subunit S [Aeromonas jandaei]
MTLTAMPKYDTYKDSGVEWLGDIPHEWKLISLKRTVVGCVNGLWGKDPNNTNDIIVLRVADFERNKLKINDKKLTVRSIPLKDRGGRLLKKGDLLIEKSGGGDKTLVGCVVLFDKDYDAITSNFVAKMTPKDKFDARFLCYLFSALYSSGVNYRSIKQTTGIQNLDSDAYLSEVAAFPLWRTQVAIANFLDQKTTQIDEAIAIKEQQIALLNERKQILIQQAVTQGLDPTVPMKNSGVAWIGKIPEHWQVKRLKFVLDERSERSLTGEEPLFMVSQQYGLVVRADYHEKAVVAASNIDSKIVYKNDLVFNKLKAHLGVFFKSNMDFKGLVSPDYAVYKVKDYISDTKILELLFRNPLYIEQFTIRATGIVEGLIRLYTSDLFDISIPIAPKDEQLKILAHIEKMSVLFDKTIEIHRDQCEKLKEYKTTLINSAVTGKIKVV